MIHYCVKSHMNTTFPLKILTKKTMQKNKSLSENKGRAKSIKDFGGRSGIPLIMLIVTRINFWKMQNPFLTTAQVCMSHCIMSRAMEAVSTQSSDLNY